MEILFLCGYFGDEHQAELARKTRTYVENAANTFQKRLIEGFRNQNSGIHIVSAPFIGAWPTAYADMFFNGFEVASIPSTDLTYVQFCNVWGYRNLSRTKAIKKEVRKFLNSTKGKERAVIVYSPHTPFLEGAVYAKKRDPSIHICLIVPDLPQYMNLSKKAHPIYDCFKRIDINRFMELNKMVDTYMLLTEYMTEPMQVGDRPYIIVEGIVDDVPAAPPRKEKRGKKIAYAGKLNESFGVKQLVEAFKLIADPEASLEICGGGELKEYIQQMAKQDTRIHYHGIVSAEEASKILREADVLVNPRQNDDEYTKYSFPSKNIEYLMTGNAVVAYMLDGMKCNYRDYLYIPQDNSATALAQALKEGMEMSGDSMKVSSKGRSYFLKELTASVTTTKLLRMIGDGAKRYA